MLVKYYLPDLHSHAMNYPASYLGELLAAGRIENNIILHIERDAYVEITQKHSAQVSAPADRPPRDETEIKKYIPDLRASARNHSTGYLAEMLSAGRIENDVILHIDVEVYQALRKKYPQLDELPSVTTQAKGLATAAGKALLNPKPVSKEQREQRLSICNACEFLIDGKRCAKCGCTVKWKVLLETWHCPINKW